MSTNFCPDCGFKTGHRENCRIYNHPKCGGASNDELMVCAGCDYRLEYDRLVDLLRDAKLDNVELTNELRKVDNENNGYFWLGVISSALIFGFILLLLS